MLKEGTYTAWYKTPRGEGTGTVHVEGGKISGGDSAFNYSGSYEFTAEGFTATITTKRYREGPHTTVFGLDEVELQLTGTVRGGMAWCSGRSKQAPDLQFEGILFLGEEDKPKPNRQRPVGNLNPDRLPKGLDNRYRTHPPFGPKP
jgi:hypothetical protein